MSSAKKPQPPTGTMYDANLARPRLKEGLVPMDTGIFVRVEEGSEPGRLYTLSDGGVYLIGREGADIALDDPKVSRKHAEIGLYGPGAYVLRDLASTNGTLINGKRVQDRVKIRNGDLIRVGDSGLRFSIIENSIAPS